MSATNPLESQQNRQSWKQDPEAVRLDILRVATAEFARNGLSGARMDEIAAGTKTSKRMIYYYYKDKRALYEAVLEAAYNGVRQGERALDLEGLAPDLAMAKLAAFTFSHHQRNPDFIRLVMIENVHHGEFLSASNVIKSLNQPAIERLENIYARGVDEGVFRRGLNAVELHWLISATSFFNVSNQSTFSLLFGAEAFTPTGQDSLKRLSVDAVMRTVLSNPASTGWRDFLELDDD